jgi:hypothetical protein
VVKKCHPTFSTDLLKVKRGQLTDDRLYKVRPDINSLVSKFQQVYVPEKRISMDEGMTA